MTTTAPAPVLAEPIAPAGAVSSWVALAGLSSLGAGAIHAAAAGAHGEHPQAVWVFTALAVAQLVWGGVALARREAAVAVIGATLGLAAVAGWVLAKSVGLPYVDGLDVPEPVQLADVSAAVLALVSAAFAGLAAAGVRGVRLPTWVAVAAVTTLATAGTISTSGHVHAHAGATATAHAAHVARPYDPALPIDLSGTPGVTPKEQAAAESLLTITLARLPQWADAKVAERAGFRTIGDGFTGTEHLINPAFLRDATTLDPDRPESLVYDTTGGGRTLVAAMYMLNPGTPLSKVPDIGGPLVQWHIHDNLCFSRTGFVQGITDASGKCANGLVKPTPAPMVHVWISKHPCGPFAALEGIAGGSIAPGEKKLCDHAHGSTS